MSNDDLTIAPISQRVRYSLRLDPANGSGIEAELGVALPMEIGACTAAPDFKIMCLGPDEWLVLGNDGWAEQLRHRLARTVEKVPSSAVDISSRHEAVSVSGPKTVSVLRALCPIDLSVEAFPIGSCTRTIFERAQIVLFREAEQSFEIEVWRSYLPYVLALLEKLSREQLALSRSPRPS